MKYAMIAGDEITKFDPVVFVYDKGKYEVICESSQRQEHYYNHLKSRKYPAFEDFLSTFSYYNIDSGKVTPEVESLLSELRSRFGLQQISQG